MSKPIYIDEGVDYPELRQAKGEYVREAEEEFAGQEVTWPRVHARAWELQEADESEE
jgi:hypothetical protein